jgi:hypothetical protein
MSDAPEMTAARLSRAKQVGERRIKLAGSFRIAGDATAGAEPDGHAIAPTSKPQPGGTLVKALARAWQNMLDAGFYTSVSEIGETENISEELCEPDPPAGAPGA